MAFAVWIAEVQATSSVAFGDIARKPHLKPLARDRSDQVIALLKRNLPVAEAPPQRLPSPPRPGIQAVHGSRLTEPSMPQAEADSIKQLRRELQARDQVIADLLQRVEQLEHRIVLTASQLDQAVGGAGPISLLPRSGGEAGAPAAPNADVATSADENTDQDQVEVAQAEVSQSEGESQSVPEQGSQPGQFGVDEAAADRALERTLVQEGVLLLPFGQAEIEPAFRYTRREVDAPTFVTQNGDTFVGKREVRRNEFQTTATLRVGLPFDSQIEVGVPYNVVDEDVTTTVGGAARNSNSETGHGFGDVSVGLAKTLLQEGAGLRPDLIARVTYDADTGNTRDNGVFLGGGFNEVSGSLSAVKRQDPLAFVGSVTYAKAFENDDIEPGDEVSFSLGTVLAASPETSLSFFFNQTFADDTKIDGDSIDGSDQVIGTLSLGAATILGRNVLLSVTGDVGLTDDAPDYAIGASLPIRFNLPTF